MKQVEVYKDALRIMEIAEYDIDHCCWIAAEIFSFRGLCFLIWCIVVHKPKQEIIKIEKLFLKDSEEVLGRELKDHQYWFNEIEHDEPKARQERINHLKELIKLYEDENNRI